MPGNILTRKRQPISHFLKQYSFLLFFIARRMKRPSSSTTLTAMNRSSPFWPHIQEFNNAFSKKRKKKKKKHESNFKELGNGKVIWTSEPRSIIGDKCQTFTRNETLLHVQRGVIRGLKKNPVWLTRLLSREWSPVSPLELIIID